MGEPGKTSFFQALGVPTKIARGTIEITTDVRVCEAGARVGASEATLLNMLNISPFTFGMGIEQIYDNGQTFSASVLDISEEQLLKSFKDSMATIAAISLATNYPTWASVMHSMVNSYKNLLAVSLTTEYTFDMAAAVKNAIANPQAAAPAAAPAGGAAPAVQVRPAEEEEEEDEDMGFGLFD